jgi:hypothetical protein
MVTSIGAIRRVLGTLEFVGLYYQVLDSNCMCRFLGYFQLAAGKRFRDSSYCDSVISECLMRKESNERAVYSG